MVILDLECYRNYFLLGWYDLETERFYSFTHADMPGLAAHCRRKTPYLVSFNGHHYDLRLLDYAIKHPHDPDLLEQLKRFSDHIITGSGEKSDYSDYWWNAPNIDLKQVLGGRNCPSLKKLVHRLRLPELETLPIDPDKWLDDAEKERIRLYNKVDVRNTLLLYQECSEALEVRRELSARYGIDCMSLADSQIAERVLAPRRGSPAPFEEGHHVMRSVVREFHFQTGQLATFYSHLCKKVGLTFERGYNPIKKKQFYRKHFLLADGELVDSFRLDDISPPCDFKFGGLHSRHKVYQEGETAYDVDVTSFYPNLILKYELFPEGLGEAFGRAYRGILEGRVRAKREGRKVEADALKIVLNSTFGKFNEWYSRLRDPICGAAVCLNGELCILRLMDLCWQNGVEVLMVNTDGILTRQDPAEPVRLWEEEMAMGLEVKPIKKYCIKDSNNHVLLYEDGTRKVKGGAFTYEKSLSRSSGFPIVNQAIVEFLLRGTPMEKTIRECRDVYLFLNAYSQGPTISEIKLAKSVEDAGEPQPPVVRFYLAAESEENLWRRNAKGWTRVADTEGVRVLNKVRGFPDDLNHELYVEKANKKLRKITGRRGNEKEERGI